MKPIETAYKGHRFRSRLEARWAVAFDALDIAWEYEPQGFMVTERISNWVEGEGRPYLPDFWFPDLKLWGEVKGSLTHVETIALLDAAAHLSSAGGTGCGQDNPGAHDLVIFGQVPPPRRRSSWPVRLHMHKGDLYARGWALDQWPQDPHDYNWIIASDAGVETITADASELLIDGWQEKLTEKMIDAYTAARSARFEYGERGA